MRRTWCCCARGGCPTRDLAAAGLDLDEPRVSVERDEVDLAEARAVVAGDDRVAQPFEVRRGEALGSLAEEMTSIGGHARDSEHAGARITAGVTDLRRGRTRSRAAGTRATGTSSGAAATPPAGGSPRDARVSSSRRATGTPSRVHGVGPLHEPVARDLGHDRRRRDRRALRVAVDDGWKERQVLAERNPSTGTASRAGARDSASRSALRFVGAGRVVDAARAPRPR